jgi:antitoxin (DNA-binding transcriptional repressor) of toxin-antitoxin stability system
MTTVTVHAAKTRLSRLIQRAAAGEEIVIVRGKTPVARLTAIQPRPVKRKFGAYRGEFEVPDGFFDPLPESELAAFEGGGTRCGCSWTPTRCCGGEPLTNDAAIAAFGAKTL